MEHSRFDPARIEQLLGGKALNLAGLLLVFLGSGYFLKVAFEHNWIAPPERVALGLIAGAVLILYAQFLAKRDARYFSEGLTALGAAIEFLSLYAAGPFFHLIGPGATFAGMIVTSGALAALGWRHRSERLGILAAIAGFLSPAIIGATQSNEWMLASYLVVLAAALLVLGELLDSKLLAPVALAGTVFYGAGHFYDAANAPIARVEILGMFYLTFALATWIVTKVRGSVDPLRIGLAACAFVIFAAALFGELQGVDRTLLGSILFGLAALHVGAAVLLRSRYQGWMAAAACTLAIPMMYGGAALASGLAFEAFALVCVGLTIKDTPLRIFGLMLLGVDFAFDTTTLATFHADAFVWNQRFVSLAALFAATVGSYFALGLKPFRNADDELLTRGLRIGAHVVALWMVGTEAADYASGYVSIVWTVFAATLIAAGLRKRDAMLRWEGLALIAAATAKVLLFDLSSLAVEYRVLGGLVVGVILIVVSYFYGRRTAAETAR